MKNEKVLEADRTPSFFPDSRIAVMIRRLAGRALATNRSPLRSRLLVEDRCDPPAGQLDIGLLDFMNVVVHEGDRNTSGVQASP